MGEERRTSSKPGRPARGRSGPGGSRPSPQTVRRRQAQQEKVAQRAAAVVEERRRTRLTGRAAVLVLVLAVLAVSYASSLRAYLQQRDQINDLQAQIADRKASIDRLEQEKERWSDEAYVAQQARERFGYVMRGETPYVVVDENGDPLETTAELPDPDSVGSNTPRAWYGEVWDSMEVAGHPPTQAPPLPKKEIGPSREDVAE